MAISVKKLIEYSKKKELGHIPSALSHLSFLNFLYENKYIIPYKHNIVIGKPYGAQAYYLIWKNLGLIDDIESLSYGVKHDEIPFINFSEETLGNALGVASGIQLANNKRTWVHLSDAAFQMGPTLEALQFIAKKKQDLIITVDSNEYQLTGKTYDILRLDSVFISSLCLDLGYNSFIIKEDYTRIPYHLKKKGPTILIFKTTKGQGVKKMEEDPVYWHYRNYED
jgi:transketolase N-terminal domain/subunit